jgi:uroporphyrinogen decarboxylase
VKHLSHRQRLQTALAHEEPDVVPLDFGTGGNTSPVPEVYASLAAHYRLEPGFKPVPHIMRLAQVDEQILRDLEIDTRPVYMKPPRRGIRPCDEPGAFYDDWGVKWKEFSLDGVIYREIAENPLGDATIDDLESYPWWPDPLDPDRYSGIPEQVQQMFEQTDYALIGCPAFNSLWERAYFLCGFQRMLEGLALEQEFVHAIFRCITDIILASLQRYLELVGPYIQVVKMGDDLGVQNNAMMSPATYQRMVKPYHHEAFKLIKRYTEAKVFLHSCGSVYKLLPDLIDAGVEILNPVQVSAKDMDTQRLKREFGDRLSFWGAIDTQHVLPYGSPDEVRAEVERRIRDLAPGGGYVLAPVHNIQADVPPINVISMYQHARQVRW